MGGDSLGRCVMLTFAVDTVFVAITRKLHRM